MPSPGLAHHRSKQVLWCTYLLNVTFLVLRFSSLLCHSHFSQCPSILWGHKPIWCNDRSNTLHRAASYFAWVTWLLSVSEFTCNSSSEPTCFSRSFPNRSFAWRPLYSALTHHKKLALERILAVICPPPHSVVTEIVTHGFMTN